MKEKWAPINQINSSKYNLAWFKLAECVARHEKERALGVLRLLVHSFNDKALAYQLEGDLFLSFDEKDEAIKRYKDAAQEYQKEKRFLEAAGVFQHLVTLVPDSKEYVLALVRLYKFLNIKNKAAESLLTLHTLWFEDGALVKACDLLSELLQMDQSEKTFTASQKFIIHVVGQKSFDKNMFKQILTFYTDKLISHDSGTQLTQFLSTLEAVDSYWHEFLCDHIEQNKK